MNVYYTTGTGPSTENTEENKVSAAMEVVF